MDPPYRRGTVDMSEPADLSTYPSGDGHAYGSTTALALGYWPIGSSEWHRPTVDVVDKITLPVPVSEPTAQGSSWGYRRPTDVMASEDDRAPFEVTESEMHRYRRPTDVMASDDSRTASKSTGSGVYRRPTDVMGTGTYTQVPSYFHDSNPMAPKVPAYPQMAFDNDNPFIPTVFSDPMYHYQQQHSHQCQKPGSGESYVQQATTDLGHSTNPYLANAQYVEDPEWFEH